MTAGYLTVDHVPLKDIIRLFSHITIHPDREWGGFPCWNWDKPAGRRKYGQVSWGGRAGKMEAPHRVMYAWAIEPVPKKRRDDSPDMEVDHLCRNTLCCNPIHLQLIPKAQNAIGEAHNAHKTHCRKGHAYTPDNIYHVQNSRRCKQCVLDRLEAWRAKTKRDHPERLREQQDRRNARKREKRKGGHAVSPAT